MVRFTQPKRSPSCTFASDDHIGREGQVGPVGFRSPRRQKRGGSAMGGRFLEGHFRKKYRHTPSSVRRRILPRSFRGSLST